MLKKVLVVTLLGLSSTTFAGGFQVKVGASAIAPSADTTVAPGAIVKGDNEIAFVILYISLYPPISFNL